MDQARDFAEEQGPAGLVLTDPDQQAFRAIEAKSGLASSLSPQVVQASLRAWRRGFRSGPVQGNPFQQGAVWVVFPDGSVPFRFNSRHAGDHPDPADILEALRRYSAAAGDHSGSPA